MRQDIRKTARRVKNLNHAAGASGTLVIRKERIVYYLVPVLQSDESLTEEDKADLYRLAGVRALARTTVDRGDDGSKSGDLDGFIDLLRIAVGEKANHE